MLVDVKQSAATALLEAAKKASRSSSGYPVGPETVFVVFAIGPGLGIGRDQPPAAPWVSTKSE